MQTTVSYGKPGQDKARVRESRYVIKVMRVNMKGGTFLGSARTKGCIGSFNWRILILLYVNITYHDVTGLKCIQVIYAIVSRTIRLPTSTSSGSGGSVSGSSGSGSGSDAGLGKGKGKGRSGSVYG